MGSKTKKEYINKHTKFLEHKLFDNKREIEEYFTIENLEKLDIKNIPTRQTLERWAIKVFENKWHCSFGQNKYTERMKQIF